ncbi:hypothetical protein MJG53_012724 [Ovis ammon polii x Ovis aries]|uniref:Uncharacterized protein n=1 Tax=Ovis ammon polii x Ovis aries TaxID=2918886 RepID=A0ACB9ULP7_9CETA|nr:hypothetical protein MJG53_012724 [Ovis ammon polii x Ovis aries]
MIITTRNRQRKTKQAKVWKNANKSIKGAQEHTVQLLEKKRLIGRLLEKCILEGKGCQNLPAVYFSSSKHEEEPNNVKKMASDIPGSVTLPVAPMAATGQVRMAGAMPARGGKRRSGMDFDDEDGEGPSKFSSFNPDVLLSLFSDPSSFCSPAEVNLDVK